LVLKNTYVKKKKKPNTVHKNPFFIYWKGQILWINCTSSKYI